MTTSGETFEAVVLRWLKQSHPDAVEVVKVEPYGTDWAGDTEGGFYSLADVTIRYRKADGTTGMREVSGEDMASLWGFVVRAWPS